MGAQVSEVPVAAGAHMRSVRARVATPYVGQGQLDSEDLSEIEAYEGLYGRRVSVREVPSGVEQVPVSADSHLRPSRDRVATPYVGMQDPSGQVRVEDGPPSVEEVPLAANAQVRSARDRMTTPDLDPRRAERRIYFFTDPSGVEEVDVSPSAQLRSARNRVATPYVDPDRRQVRIAHEVEQIDEVVANPGVRFRPLHERTVTPWVEMQQEYPEDMADAEEQQRLRHQQQEFANRQQVRLPRAPPQVEQVAVSPHAQLRPTRDRNPTPFASQRQVVIDDEVAVMGEAEYRNLYMNGSAPNAGAQFRPARNRQPTPWVSPEVAQRSLHPSISMGAQVSEVPVAAGAHMRSVRARVATPYVGQGQLDSEDLSEIEAYEGLYGRRVSVREVPSGVEQVPVSADSHLRPSRDRVATPYVGMQDPSGQVRVEDGPPSVEEVPLAANAQVRSARDRMTTPDLDPRRAERRIYFFTDPSGVEEVDVSPSAQLRSARNRVATPYVDPGRRQVRIAHEAEQIDEVRVESPSRLRPAHQRIATPYVTMEDVQLSGGRSVRVPKNPASVQQVDRSPTAQMRPLREGHAVPFAAEAPRRQVAFGVDSPEVIDEVVVNSPNRMRPAHDRTVTPFVTIQDERVVAEGVQVTINTDPVMEEVGIETPNRLRSVHQRMATPYLTMEERNRIRFAAGEVVLDAASQESAPGESRSVRSRIPTGFVSNEVLLRADSPKSLSPHSMLPPGVSPKSAAAAVAAAAQGRPVLVQGMSSQTEKVHFAEAPATLDAASMAANSGRSIRDRVPTGYVSEEASCAFVGREEVDFVDIDDEGSGREGGPPASMGEGHDHERVRFGNDDVIVDAASEGPVQGQARMIRGRTLTLWVRADQLPRQSQVSFALDQRHHHHDHHHHHHHHHDEDPGSPPIAGDMRTVRNRSGSGSQRSSHEELPGIQSVQESGVSFAAGDHVIDVAAAEGAMRPWKSRTQTSFRRESEELMGLALDQDLAGSTPARSRWRLHQDETGDGIGANRAGWTDASSSKSGSDSGSAGVTRRPSTGEEDGGPVDRVSSAEDAGALSDVETLSSSSSRNPRSRMNTPFMSINLGVDNPETPSSCSVTSMVPVLSSEEKKQSRKRSKGHATPNSDEVSLHDRDKIKQVSMVARVERKISVLVQNSERQAREDRLLRVKSGGIFEGTAAPPPMLGLHRDASEPALEPELLMRLVPGAAKDKEMLKNTLKQLQFFEDFEESALDELSDAMDVYSFNDGDKAVRQGDPDGTHFYVVASGAFKMVRDGREVARLLPGESFGESVLLLFGERTCTVLAEGAAKAYGIEGSVVRDILRQQFERHRQVVFQALDEVLETNKCALLTRLSPYQLQSLYEKVEIKTFPAGSTLLQEGDTELQEVLLLFSGRVTWHKRFGCAAGVLDMCGLVGVEAVAFCDRETRTYVAETDVQCLSLSTSLLNSVFSDQLHEVLAHDFVHNILARHQVFSRLIAEQVDAVATMAVVETLASGEEREVEGIRFGACLHGSGEARWKMLTSEGESSPNHRQEKDEVVYFCSDAPDLDSVTFGDLRRHEHPARMKLRASEDFSNTKVVLWKGKDLDSILHDEDLNFALDQNYKVRVLKSVVLFKTLALQQLQRLAQRLQIQHAQNGARIVEQGTIGTHFYILRKGRVQVVIRNEVIRALGIGDYFGERALIFNEPRTAHIDAIEDSELWVMDNETFREVMQGPCLDYLQSRIQLQDTKVELKDLQFMRIIGRGGYGIVKMVRHPGIGMRYALKCVRKRPIVEMNQQETIINERIILMEVDHPFIVKCVRSFTSPKCVYFLTELVSGGELLDVLYKLGLLDREQAMFYAGSIVLALEFLHARRIAYLDLKSENCLIDHQGYLKLIDFGIAMRIRGKGFGKRGTPMFMAPEMIRNVGFTTTADLWSLGICLYEFVIGEFPFANNYKEVLDLPLRFPDNFYHDVHSQDTVAMIKGLLTKDPSKRLGAGADGYAAIKEHPFFKGLDWDALLGRELKPPYIPKGETYAEEQVEGGSAGPSMTVLEHEAQDDPDGDWEDPNPGWDVCF